MPRYHFDTECGELRYHDSEGVDLGSIGAAQEQLLGLLRDMTFTDDGESSNKTVTAIVRCGDNVVLQGSMSLSVDRQPVWSPKL